MPTLSAFSPPSWLDPNSASTFLTDPTDDNPTSVVDFSDDHHDPQSPPNPNLNLHNNHPFSSSPPEPAPSAPCSPPSLFHVCFNQDHACFAMGTDHGFQIYNYDPFLELFHRDFDNGGGIGVVKVHILGLGLDCRERSGQL